MILLDQAGAGAAGTRLFSPSYAQARFVEHFWSQQPPSGQTGRLWRIIPDANPHLIFVISREEFGGNCIRCFLVGPRSRFADVAIANRVLTCGARLRPGVLPLLTHLPASDFTNCTVPVEEVFGARGRSLTNRLGETRSSGRAVAALARFLSSELAGHDCVRRFPRGMGSCVEGMAREAGMPIRTLHSRLIRYIGLSPKRLLRIERLHRALAGCQDRPVAGAQLAADCGFADQAHMIREFHDLLGESPTAWSRRSRLPICSRQ